MILLFLFVASACASDCTSETCPDTHVLLQARQSVEKFTKQIPVASELGKVEVVEGLDELISLGHSVGAVQASIDDASRDLLLTFHHQGHQLDYRLSPHSVYTKDASVYADGILIDDHRPRTFRSRSSDKGASAAWLDHNMIRGLFEHDGGILEVTPVSTFHDLAPALLQDSNYDNDALPAHLIRWVAFPELGSLRNSLGLSVSEVRTANETHGFFGDTSSVGDFGDGSHIPDPPSDTNLDLHSDWHGVKWWPGCYNHDFEMHEFILTIVTDKAAKEKTPDGQSHDYGLGPPGDALKTKIEYIVNEASWVYERQINIKLKIGHLAMDNTGSDYGECPAEGEESYDRLLKMKKAVETGKVPAGAASHFFTGCGKEHGVAGLAYLGKICEGEWAVGSNKIHVYSSWLVFAHELGHNFNARHSVEDGKGTTGGIMDYGDGKVDGEYQFTAYRKEQMCSKIDSVVGECDGKFQIDPDPPPPPPPPMDPFGGKDPFGPGGGWDPNAIEPITPPPIEVPTLPPGPLPYCKGYRLSWQSDTIVQGNVIIHSSYCESYGGDTGGGHLWCNHDRQTSTPGGGIPENNGLLASEVCSECGRCRDKVYAIHEPYVCAWRGTGWCRCNGEMYLGKKYVSGSSGTVLTFKQMKEHEHAHTPLNPAMAFNKSINAETLLPSGKAIVGSFSATKLRCWSGDCPYTAGTFVPRILKDLDRHQQMCWCDPSVPSTILGPVTATTTPAPTQAPPSPNPTDSDPGPWR